MWRQLGASSSSPNAELQERVRLLERQIELQDQLNSAQSENSASSWAPDVFHQSFVERERECWGGLAAPLDEAILDVDGVGSGGAVWDVDGRVDSLPEVVEESGKGRARGICGP